MTTNLLYRKTYSILQNAIDGLDDSSNDGTECDLVIISPPDPDLQTNEEEFDDDMLSDLKMPYDVPGTIEVYYGRSIYDKNLLRD